MTVIKYIKLGLYENHKFNQLQFFSSPHLFRQLPFLSRSFKVPLRVARQNFINETNHQKLEPRVKEIKLGLRSQKRSICPSLKLQKFFLRTLLARLHSQHPQLMVPKKGTTG